MSHSQGQGEGTRRKEEGHATIFRQSLLISTAPSVSRFPYWAIDLNAGSGWNEKVGCSGSPVVFLEEAGEVFREGPINAYFCDISEEAILQLRGRMHGLIERIHAASVTAMAMNNAVFLEVVAEEIRRSEKRPQYAIGSCLCDPNGYKGLPVAALSKFAVEFPRIDIVLNINCTLFKTAEGCKTSEKLAPALVEAFRRWPTVPEILDAFHRAHWMIRNPSRSSGHRFTQLIGRSMDTGNRSFKGFYSLASPEGQKILANLRRIEPDQGFLFKEME